MLPALRKVQRRRPPPALFMKILYIYYMHSITRIAAMSIGRDKKFPAVGGEFFRLSKKS